MSDLEDWPEHFVLLLALMTGILGVFHFVGEFEECIFNIFKAFWRRLAVLCCPDGWHSCGEISGTFEGRRCREERWQRVRCDVELSLTSRRLHVSRM